MDSILFDLIKNHCQGYRVQEERKIDPEHIELIIFRKDMGDWVTTFSSQLGNPIKPEGQKPTEEHDKITSSYGGINEYQTLFRKNFDNNIVLIMLWPWGDEEHVTLHMILQ